MNDFITAVKGQAITNKDNPDDYFKIKEIINRVNILMKHELRKASCTIKYEVEVDGEFEIKGNINYIIQVLNNLISNAIDSYDNKKGGAIEIIIEQKFPYKIGIIVKDYGKGIKDIVKEKLFRQMVTTKGKDGTGLGLYISKSIITSKFNGEIRVESEEGKGSSFIITIPIGGKNGEQHKHSNS
jgi:signal transduction histidine kinase